MGQLWNRVRRFVRSNTDENSISSISTIDIIDEENDALRMEIDNLTNAEQSNSRYKYKQKYGKAETELQKSYRILELKNTASIEEIKAAYKRKIREVHPDLLVSKTIEEQEKAKLKLHELNSAYAYLKRVRNF